MIKYRKKLILLEAKSIEDEYNKTWSSIDKEVFDTIISIDPQTNIERNIIGPNAKQLLLPKYIEGETDFLDNIEETTEAISKFIKERSTYKIKNIAAYPSVDIFVKHILNPENNPVDEVEIKKESKIDEIYKKYYNDIPREDFDYLISLDPETNLEKEIIGDLAKNLLLAIYKKGDKSVVYKTKKDKIINALEEYKKNMNNFSKEARELTRYSTIDDFIKLTLFGEESDFYKHVMNTCPDSVKYIGSTLKYDVWEVLDTFGAAVVAGAEVEFGGPGIGENQSRSWQENAFGHWCTTSRIHWSSYNRSGEKYYDFILKVNPKSDSRANNYQLAIRPDGSVRESCNGVENQVKEEEVFTKDSYLLELCSELPEDCYLSKLNIVKNYIMEKKVFNKPIELYSLLDQNELQLIKSEVFKLLAKDIIIFNGPKYIPSTLFANCVNLRSISIPESVEIIGNQAFAGCVALQNPKSKNGADNLLPKNLKSIGMRAFAGCKNLKGTIDIPNSLIEINKQAFYGTDSNLTLSFNSDRETKLNIWEQDKDWFIKHSKQKKMNEELNKKFEINENIPRDLLQAYRTATKSAKGGSSDIAKAYSHKDLEFPMYDMWLSHLSSYPVAYPVNAHRREWHIDLIDYGKAKYKELSYDKAVEYLNLRNGKTSEIADKLVNLRLIIDYELAQWEKNTSNKIYYLYSCEVPWDRFEKINFEGFKGKGTLTNDTKFAQKVSDIDACLKCADKIYWTNEHEFIRSEERKNEISQKHKTVKDTYIVDPQKLKDKINYILPTRSTEIIDKDLKELEYDYDEILNTRLRPEVFANDIPDIEDTGTHRTQNAALKKLISIAQKALKKLESTQSLYSAEEYTELYADRKTEIEELERLSKNAYNNKIKDRKKGRNTERTNILYDKINRLKAKKELKAKMIENQIKLREEDLRTSEKKLIELENKIISSADLGWFSEQFSNALDSCRENLKYYKDALIKLKEINSKNTELIEKINEVEKFIKDDSEKITSKSLELWEKYYDQIIDLDKVYEDVLNNRVVDEIYRLNNKLEELKGWFNRNTSKKYSLKKKPEKDDKFDQLFNVMD